MPLEQHLSDPDLWRRICEYEFPKDGFGHSFAQHLANLSHLPADDVLCLIEEYRRFAYVSALQDHLMVAPPLVDRVWAHHRAFGEAYDKEFLPLIGLQSWHPFEGPRRARRERLLNADLYYEREFGTRPPAIVWRRSALWRVIAAFVILLASVLGPLFLSMIDVFAGVMLTVGVLCAGAVAQPYFHEDLPWP